MTLRPRRSVLYLPGSNVRALDKARTLPADAVILDLEDAVAPEAKIQARQNIEHALKTGGYGRREVIIRINALNSAWGNDDLKTLAHAGADAILLPKVETPTQISTALSALDHAGAPTDLGLWVMIETPRAVLDIDAIVKNQIRLKVLVMGTSDLSKGITHKTACGSARVNHSPQPMRTGRPRFWFGYLGWRASRSG